ncbi:hypothetical protein BJV74DRAFT_866374 [Russula compacta]|nr:hypothetical protein BJV74DRAFT_866374 [Russula compacta]
MHSAHSRLSWRPTRKIVIMAERKCPWMVHVSIVLTPMRVPTIPVSILGARFAMDVFPTIYRSLVYASVRCVVPVMGILCGNATSGLRYS